MGFPPPKAGKTIVQRIAKGALGFPPPKAGENHSAADRKGVYKIISCLGERVMSMQPSSVSMITSSMRTPNLPGR